MPKSKPKFDESKLLPEQRRALAIANAQGVKPIRSMDELRLNIEADELAKFADALDEQRTHARSHPAKDKF